MQHRKDLEHLIENRKQQDARNGVLGEQPLSAAPRSPIEDLVVRPGFEPTGIDHSDDAITGDPGCPDAHGFAPAQRLHVRGAVSMQHLQRHLLTDGDIDARVGRSKGPQANRTQHSVAPLDDLVGG